METILKYKNWNDCKSRDELRSNKQDDIPSTVSRVYKGKG